MKRITSLTGVVFVGIALLVAQSAVAEYVSIQHNLVDGTNDTSFNVGTGELSWVSPSPNLTLNDPGPLLGTVSNVTVELETFLSSTNGQEAIFTGGDFSLRFDFDGTAVRPTLSEARSSR